MGPHVVGIEMFVTGIPLTHGIMANKDMNSQVIVVEAIEAISIFVRDENTGSCFPHLKDFLLLGQLRMVELFWL